MPSTTAAMPNTVTPSEKAGEREDARDECADQHPEQEDRRIAVALAREYELTSGATSGECGGQPQKQHTQEIPKVIGVLQRLVVESGHELVEENIHCERGDQEGYDAVKEIGIP